MKKPLSMLMDIPKEDLPFTVEQIAKHASNPALMAMARALLEHKAYIQFSKYEIMAAVLHDLYVFQEAAKAKLRLSEPQSADKELSEKLRDIAQALSTYLNPGDEPATGFVLLVFPVGEGEARCQMAANVTKQDVAATLKNILSQMAERGAQSNTVQ